MDITLVVAQQPGVRLCPDGPLYIGPNCMPPGLPSPTPSHTTPPASQSPSPSPTTPTTSHSPSDDHSAPATHHTTQPADHAPPPSLPVTGPLSVPLMIGVAVVIIASGIGMWLLTRTRATDDGHEDEQGTEDDEPPYSGG